MNRTNSPIKLVSDAAATTPGGADDSAKLHALRATTPQPPVQPEILQLLFEGPATYVTDINGHIVFTNQAFRDLGQRLGCGMDPDGIAHIFPLHEVLADALASNGPVRREDVHSLGKEVLYLTSEHRVLHDAQGNITGVGGLFRDSTREASAWLEADAAKSRFRDIARLVSDWIWETDAEFDLTFVSGRAMEILGLHSRHMIGRNLFSLGTFLADETSAKMPTPATRSPFRNLQFIVLAATGEPCLFELSGIPVFDEERGAFQGFRGTARNITDIKAREEALVSAKNMAEVANRTKGEFLANMSHELRTPLNAIIGFSEIMDRGTFGDLGSDRYKSYVRDIIRSSRHLLGIINDILEAAKMEAGKLELDEEEIDLAAEARTTVQFLNEQAAIGQLTMTVVAPESLPKLYADPRRVHQILLNLLSNAIKFTPPEGKVTVEIGRTSKGGILLAVIDTGIGIAVEDIPKALMPFGQVDGSLNRRHEGTGLGLPLTKALAELHDAELAIDSMRGKGTRVTVAFPTNRTRSTV
jgi:PAS domain S-box-containing protein